MPKFTSFLSLSELPAHAQKAIEKRQQNITAGVPLQIEGLCVDLGIGLQYGKDYPTREQAYMDSTCPVAITRDTTGFIIFCNSNHEKTRRLYSITHAVARILLEGENIFHNKTAKHCPMPGSVTLPGRMQGQPLYIEDNHYRGGLGEESELATNQLTAMILMPLEKVDEFVARDGKLGTLRLGEHFGVSDKVAAARMGFPAY